MEQDKEGGAGILRLALVTTRKRSQHFPPTLRAKGCPQHFALNAKVQGLAPAQGCAKPTAGFAYNQVLPLALLLYARGVTPAIVVL